MMRSAKTLITLLGFALAALFTCQPTLAADKPFTFGLLMVGPANDHGWSQAHFEAAKEIEKKVPGTKMI
ncbi:MAG: BMP family ABC transporter substrate-binding protein, partial [Desulfobulbus sp.]